MNNSSSLISSLFSIRNRYGAGFPIQKIKLLNAIGRQQPKNKKDIQPFYDTLLFLIAYPDNAGVYRQARQSLQQLELHIQSDKRIRNTLYNSGITQTQVCAAYSFELVKWLRKKHPGHIRLVSFEAGSGQIQSILAAVLPKVQSEILQDAITDWKKLLTQSLKKGESLLDRLIAIFDETDIRPEVKDELWAAIGINVEIDFPVHHSLPHTLDRPHYHQSLLKEKKFTYTDIKPVKLKLTEGEAEAVIECGRMILVRHLREIDPITFTAPRFVSYYRLQRGISIALLGMMPERRHPIDSYLGYVVFKNGLPVAYAGSWILFDSGRIGLNIFPSYRGGESHYIFHQVLKLHSKVYKLNRFSVDPYQLGKENEDGIDSGAFWIYYHCGFRPLRKEQRLLAESELKKIKAIKGYRSPSRILKKLSCSRMELVLKKKAFRFDVNDLSMAYTGILKAKFDGNRKQAEEDSYPRLAGLLKIKNYQEDKIKFVLKNWSVLLISCEKEWENDKRLKNKLKKLFELKTNGSEEDYIAGLQRTAGVRKLLEKILNNTSARIDP